MVTVYFIVSSTRCGLITNGVDKESARLSRSGSGTCVSRPLQIHIVDAVYP
jgi:hypothetical protein